MKKIRSPQDRVIGFINGKRVKTTAKKWLKIMEDKNNSVVFKEDKNIEPEAETRGYTEEEKNETTQ